MEVISICTQRNSVSQGLARQSLWPARIGSDCSSELNLKLPLLAYSEESRIHNL